MTRIRRTVAVALLRAANWAAGGHAYLSTSCLHAREPGREDLHGYCQSRTGHNPAGERWAKKPGSCKFCGAKCLCRRCHQEAPDA